MSGLFTNYKVYPGGSGKKNYAPKVKTLAFKILHFRRPSRQPEATMKLFSKLLLLMIFLQEFYLMLVLVNFVSLVFCALFVLPRSSLGYVLDIKVSFFSSGEV